MTRALERVAGLQAQWEPAPPLGLWARLEGFRAEELDQALARRTAVRATLMRATIHLVSSRDYLRFHPALLPMLQRKWRQHRSRVPEDPELEKLAGRILAAAAEPRRAGELKPLLEPDDELGTRWFRIRHHVPLIRLGLRYVAAEAWLGRPFAPVEEGLRHLVRRYLAAFGPATTSDVAAWSGLQVAELREELDRMRLRRFRDEQGRVLYDLQRAPLPPADVPAPPRLLPRFDSLILSHADRTRVVSEEHRRLVIKGGEVDPVLLVDGFVAGRWRREGKRIELEPFVPLRRSELNAIRAESDALARWLLRGV
ncbi:MAG: winged helix DNA-binding domain-containing protein [Gaiellaceae bacterium]